MTFKPGQSGNPGGRSHLRQLTNDLRKLVAQNPEKVRKISQHILDTAEGGDLAYIQFLYDRLEGKAAQTVDINENVAVTVDDRRQLLSEFRQRTRQKHAVDLTPLLDAPEGS